MNYRIPFALCGCLFGSVSADTAITVYNQNFGVIRDTVSLELEQGISEADFSGVTAQLEPESVVLRDPTGAASFTILEQSYRSDPVDQARLLQMFEGRVVEFSKLLDDEEVIVEGRIVRAPTQVMTRDVYGNTFQKTLEPIIEVDGQLQMRLPGTPLFPSLGDDSILQPTLSWKLHAAEVSTFDAQLSYVTSGMSWKADYNLVFPVEGDVLTLTGWVSIENNTGTRFDDAKIKLIAGDVNKVQNRRGRNQATDLAMARAEFALEVPEVEAKKFDDFHMYSLPLRTSLRDGETKQVEFIRAEAVQTTKRLVYDGASLRYRGGRNLNQAYGQNSQPDVAIYREFINSDESGLGVALPAGRTRFYRMDSDGQLEFTGENNIDHTPKDERVSVYLGNAFDVVGERTRTEFFKHPSRDLIRETFEVEIRNRGDEAVTVQVLERLYRGSNWEIRKTTKDFEKIDSNTIEFPVWVDAGETQTVSYTVQYTW